jgi:multidrug efflux pump subunit AcrA (membrane-fusion protein)
LASKSIYTSAGPVIYDRRVFLPIACNFFQAGSFSVRQVKLGPSSNGFYPVLDGLKVNDEVVREGSFVLKAEAIRQHPEL